MDIFIMFGWYTFHNMKFSNKLEFSLECVQKSVSFERLISNL